MDKAAKGVLVVLDLNLVAEDGDFRDDSLNMFVFFDGIHDVPYGAEVEEGIANLLLGEVTPIRIQLLRFRQNPENNLRFGQHDIDVPNFDLFELIQRDTLQGTGGIDALAVSFANEVTTVFVLGHFDVDCLHRPL